MQVVLELLCSCIIFDSRHFHGPAPGNFRLEQPLAIEISKFQIKEEESTSCLIQPALHKTHCWWCHTLYSPPTCSPLSPSITHSLFHSRLKTHLFLKSFPP